MNGRPWTPRCQQILRIRAEMRYTNAEIQADIQTETGRKFSLFTISRYRSAAGLPSPRPTGNCRALRRWRAIEAAA